MKSYYDKMELNILVGLLEIDEFSSGLAYIVDYKNYSNLFVEPHKFSIEVYNDNITIIIILYSGFELNEYLDMKHRKNLHIISFNSITNTMVEFEQLNVKYIDKMAWLFSILSRAQNEFAEKLQILKDLKI